MYGLIFDVDGVIADTETLNAHASVLMFQELYGVTVQAEDFRPFVGHGDERYVEGVAEKYGVQVDPVAAVSRRKDNFFKLLANTPLPAMPGVPELIAAAREAEDFKVAIATSGNCDKQFPVIEGTGLKLTEFDAVITGDDVTLKKPDPQIYTLTAQRLGLEPAFCIVMEDAPAGVTAAKAAGMKCVAITSSVDREQLTAADCIVDSFVELDLAILRSILD